MIYTCYEMVRDCRAERPEGWTYFVTHYVPVIHKLLEHYFGDNTATDRVLLALRSPGSSLFRSEEAAPERVFVARLRQSVMAAMEGAGEDVRAEIVIELDELLDALGPLTAVEKQA